MIEIKGNIAYLPLDVKDQVILFYRELGYEVQFYV